MAMITDTTDHAYVIQASGSGELPQWLVDILDDDMYVKAGANIAFDCRWCERFGYKVNGVLDVSTMEHVLDCTDPNKGLKWLAMSYLPRLGNYERDLEALRKKRGKKKDWHLIEDSEMYEYAAADAMASYASARAQLAKIQGYWPAIPARLMIELYPHLTDMYIKGLPIDRSVTEQLDRDMDIHLGHLRHSIQTELGPINPSSHIQLAKALIAKIPSIDLSVKQVSSFLYKEDEDNEDDEEYTTCKAVLERERYKHPVIDNILEFRQWSKLHSAFIKAMLDKHLVYHDNNWYIHPAYNTAIVETYRLSSSKPNIQQIPRKNKNPTLNIKRQFVPSHPGGMLLNADYGQMEMRVGAWLSQDPALLKAVETEDVHLTTAELMYQRPKGSVTKESEERQNAKAIGFATMYGAGARTIGKHLGIHKDKAKVLIDLYFKAYPGLRTYIQKVHGFAMENLYVETPFGFRRPIASPPNGNWETIQGFRAKRQAFNTVIQSTAACVMYCAIICINREFEKEGLKSRILNTVHDSLLVDVAPGELSQVATIVRECMLNPETDRFGVHLDVPLAVDIEVGKNWGELEKVA